MNKKNVFLNLLSVYGVFFLPNVKSIENQKIGYGNEIILNVNTENFLYDEAMNKFCENCC